MRALNFGAGPATLPETLLIQAKADLLDWQGQGMSVMEISHRSEAFMALLDELTERLKRLLKVPASYHVLWLGAPARFHFGAIPHNFLKSNADYIVSGTWSKLAMEDAKKYGEIRLAASNAESDFLAAPRDYQFNEGADYCYFTPNETLTGLYLREINSPQSVPLIADMTSCILSEPISVSDYAMIFAGAQKNLAPSGLSLAIISPEFLATKQGSHFASFFDYEAHAKNKSNYATPPTFNVYMANLMLKWLEDKGGIEKVHALNKKKAAMLYHLIDESNFYECQVNAENRSIMNVAFRLANESLNSEFLLQAKSQGLVALKGHRSFGGMRASIYNAMPYEGVEALTQFMSDFANSYG